MVKKSSLASWRDIGVDVDLRAIEYIIKHCPNLVSFKFRAPFDDLAGAQMALAPLFSDEQRASKLKNLEFYGDLDEAVLNSIFDNCINVESLSIRHCPQLRDYHLIGWTGRGVRLSKLVLLWCDNVTDKGLIPVLLNSGDQLEICKLRLPKITDRSYRVLIDACRYVQGKGIKFPNKDLKKLADSKLLYKLDD